MTRKLNSFRDQEFFRQCLHNEGLVCVCVGGGTYFREPVLIAREVTS